MKHKSNLHTNKQDIHTKNKIYIQNLQDLHTNLQDLKNIHNQRQSAVMGSIQKYGLDSPRALGKKDRPVYQVTLVAVFAKLSLSTSSTGLS